MPFEYNGPAGGSGGVQAVAAGDTSIVVAGTASHPTIETADLSTIAADHATAADVAMNAHKITGLANGAAAQDAAAFGQIPASLPPSGAAGGDLTGNYPNPTLAAAGGGAAGPIGSTSVIPVVTVDAKGRVTALTSASPSLSSIAAPSADVPWAAHKITGLANGVAASDAAAFGQIPAALPPSGAAGGKLSGTFPNPGVPGAWDAIVYTSADRSTASVTLVDVTDLLVALAANSTYEIEIVAACNASTSAGGHLAYAFSAAGATGQGVCMVAQSATGASLSAIALAAATQTAVNTGGTTFDCEVVIKATVVVGANAGNLTVQAKKNTSGTMIVRKGSSMKVNKNA